QAAFDTNHLQFKSATSERFGYAITPIVDGSQIVLAFTKVGPKTGESGTVELAELVFAATAAGSASVELEKVITVNSAMQVAESTVNETARLTVVPATDPSGPGTTPDIPAGNSPGSSTQDSPAVIIVEDHKVVIRNIPSVVDQ